MKLDDYEKDILDNFESGLVSSKKLDDEDRKRLSRIASNTLKKSRRVNIRLSDHDLQAIQRKAIQEGLPYQTLIASLIHKYTTGRLNET